MLVVIYKKLDKIEQEVKGSHRSAPDSTYWEEMKSAAAKIKESLEKETLSLIGCFPLINDAFSFE